MASTEDEIHSALLDIRARLDVVEGKVTVIARADRPKLLSELKSVVQKQPDIGRIYLAVDGQKNQNDIAAEVGVSIATVSRRLADMSREYGMVEMVPGQESGKVYRHDGEMEKVLHLTANVAKWLDEIAKAKKPVGKPKKS